MKQTSKVAKTARARSSKDADKGARRPLQQRSRITREKLMDAALECIAEFGYQAATMDQIVARAGTSRGAQVHHFPTKLDLVEAAMEHLLNKVVADVREHTDKIREDRERPEELFEYLWTHYFSGQAFQVNLELVVAARTNARLKERTSAVSDRFHKSLDDCWYLLCRSSSMEQRRLVLLLNLTVTLLRGMGFQLILWDRKDYFNELLQEWQNMMREYFPALAAKAPAERARR